MPTRTDKDSQGCFARWGHHGKKYYYECNNDAARRGAIKKANAQGQAAHAHGYTGNAEGAIALTFMRVVANLKPVVRRDTMEGHEWVVAPAQMITEGVHNGSDGPIFYPAEELAKLPSAWNHMPVVVYHPVENGVAVSARTPEQLTSRKIGVLMNTKWDDKNKKLGTETWLDPTRVAAVDSRVADAVANNEMMELSTGLFMNLERKEGEWNGEPYIGIAHDLQPDHLALLPDLKGACSIADGAGFLRVNVSHEETRRLLQSAVRENDNNAWIEEVHDKFFIYETEGKLYKQDYTIDDSIVSFTGLSKLVERKVTFVEITGLSNNDDPKEGDTEMDKKKVVDALIKNERTSWKEEHRDVLMKLDDAILTNLAHDAEEMLKPPAVNKDEPDKDQGKETPAGATPPAGQDGKEKVPQTNARQEPAKPETVDEYIAKAPSDVRESLRMSVNAMNAEKARLIEVIKANGSNTFTDEHLKVMDFQMLQAIAKIAQPATNDAETPQRTIPLYFGQGDTPAANGGQLPEPLPLPVMNFEKADKKTA